MERRVGPVCVAAANVMTVSWSNHGGAAIVVQKARVASGNKSL